MSRIREIKDYLITQGGFQPEEITCHTSGGEIVPVESQTETGIHLFDDQYTAVIYIEDVSEKQLGYLKLLLYEWFRLNRQNEEESFRISSDEISDLSSLVTIDLTLVETTHLGLDVDGKIERDGIFYSFADNPNSGGI